MVISMGQESAKDFRYTIRRLSKSYWYQDGANVKKTILTFDKSGFNEKTPEMIAESKLRSARSLAIIAEILRKKGHHEAADYLEKRR